MVENVIPIILERCPLKAPQRCRHRERIAGAGGIILAVSARYTHMSSEKLPSFDKPVTVIGDVMLDRYWYGDSSRISPEAPVPVVNVKSREDRAGGAANVALNISSLGAPARLIGIVGEDSNAVKLESILKEHGIDTAFINVRGHPTITKLRVLSRNQQLLRLDFEDSLADLPGERLLEAFRKDAQDSGIIIASDYGKGTLSHIPEIIKLAAKASKKVLIDPKGTDFSRYDGAFMLTPNMKEFEAVAGKVSDNDDLERRALAMIAKFHLGCLLVTRSEDGMSLIRPGYSAVHLPTRAREVYDVTGAGDTVIGTLGAALACGVDLVDACEIANRAAGIVVGKVGTSTVSPDELERALRGDDASLSAGAVTEDRLVQEVARLKAEGKRIVMTNGCFDILHAGHVSYLKRARALGDRLIVAVNTDRSVKALKGPTRPVNPLEARMEVLAALDCVDYVVPFDEDTPQRLIARILPDVLVKGGDYTVEQIAGHKEVQANGGQVVVLPFLPGYSTTSIIEKLKK